ncbi:LcrG family type III secretion system chaperone [Pseudomonas koreensis]|jgi:type III secretion system LcrG-like protein|uniref:LcrG family type III secretion system chaperone n=1 Tax=Pseudomonas koreensis TaxID=198620 RepID=UPI001B33D725|nr:LcrG family type III secretion system chaperone [Pseudomonas koreensis]MBP3996483.1 LcrG family type III secretion system chaperone [Pseudomonas koreensis]
MYDEPYATTLQAAEQAIDDNEHRARLLTEMWEGLGLPAQACDRIFRSQNQALVQVAEQELLQEVQRMRINRPPVADEGKRLRRPASMRGLLV